MTETYDAYIAQAEALQKAAAQNYEAAKLWAKTAEERKLALEKAREDLAVAESSLVRARTVIKTTGAARDAAQARVVELKTEVQRLQEALDGTTPPPTGGDDPPPPASDLEPQHAFLDMSIQACKDDAWARHRAKVPRPINVGFPTSETKNEVSDHRNFLFDMTWQWAFNRYLLFGADGTPLAPPQEVSTFQDLELRDVNFEGAKWIIRSYNNYKVLVDRCTFRHPKRPGFAQAILEHDGYFETENNYTWQDTYSEGGGGHASYYAHRPYPFAQYGPSNRHFAERCEFKILRSIAIDKDQGPGRGAFANQWFNPGDFVYPGDVLMEDMEVYSKWDFVRSQGSWDPIAYEDGFQPGGSGSRTMNCNGAFVVHHYDFAKHVERARSLGVTNTHPTETVTVRRPRIKMSFSQMPIAAIRGTKHIIIEDGGIGADPRHKSPHVWIDDDKSIRDYCEAETITVRNMRFDGATVRKVLLDGSFLDFPTDLVGRVATWRKGMTSVEVRDL